MYKVILSGIIMFSLAGLVFTGCGSNEIKPKEVISSDKKNTTEKEKNISKNEVLKVSKIDELRGFTKVEWIGENLFLVEKINKLGDEKNPYSDYGVFIFNLSDKKLEPILDDEKYEYNISEVSKDKRNVIIYERVANSEAVSTKYSLMELTSKKINPLFEGIRTIRFKDNENIIYTTYGETNKAYVSDFKGKVVKEFKSPQNFYLSAVLEQKLQIYKNNGSNFDYYECDFDGNNFKKIPNPNEPNIDNKILVSSENNEKTVEFKIINENKGSLVLLKESGKETEELIPNYEWNSNYFRIPPVIQWMPDERTIIFGQTNIDNSTTVSVMDIENKKISTLLKEKDSMLSGVSISKDGSLIIANFSPITNLALKENYYTKILSIVK